jgi:hypothetical protein
VNVLNETSSWKVEDTGTYHESVSGVPTAETSEGEIPLKLWKLVRQIITMGTLTKVAKRCYYIISRSISKLISDRAFMTGERISTTTDNPAQAPDLYQGRYSFAKVLSQTEALQTEENEEELKHRLQAEIEDIMSQVGEDGFTPDDKAILRSNLPIPEEYGIYDPIPDHLRKSIPIKYVAEEDIFVVDEERMESRRDKDF